MLVPGHLTSQEETLTVGSTAVGPTDATFGTCVGVIGMVLSSSIYLTLHDPEATPDAADFVLYTGDTFAAYPGHKVRMIRSGSDSCVKLQGWVP